MAKSKMKGGAMFRELTRLAVACGMSKGLAYTVGWDGIRKHFNLGLMTKALVIEDLRARAGEQKVPAKAFITAARRDMVKHKGGPSAAINPSREANRPARYRGDVAGDAFLQSYEWRRVRMQVLKKHGARCQCCGASPATGAVMNVDHIKPRRIYPELALDITNLQVLCDECNHGKGNWDMTDWREKECASDAANAEADARFQHVARQAARL